MDAPNPPEKRKPRQAGFANGATRQERKKEPSKPPKISPGGRLSQNVARAGPQEVLVWFEKKDDFSALTLTTRAVWESTIHSIFTLAPEVLLICSCRVEFKEFKEGLRATLDEKKIAAYKLLFGERMFIGTDIVSQLKEFLEAEDHASRSIADEEAAPTNTGMDPRDGVASFSHAP